MPTKFSMLSWPPATTRPNSRKIQCRPTGCGGSIFKGFTSFAAAMSRKRRAVSICTAAPCSAFWEKRRHVKSGRYQEVEDLFDKDLLQLIDIERFLFGRRIPREREPLEAIPCRRLSRPLF